MRKLKKLFEHIREDIHVIMKHDPAARSKLEIMINYPGFHAVQLYRIHHWLWCKHFFLLARTISSFARWITGIDIHPGAQIGRRLFIDHGMATVIGETTIIGHDCILYHNVTLGALNPPKNKKGEIRHPILENDVIVGAGAQVLGPIRIGCGARIGANSVITEDVDKHTTVTCTVTQKIRARGCSLTSDIKS